MLSLPLQNGNETEDLSEQNGDQKTDNEATAVEKEAANPRTAFNSTLVNLLKGLVRHLNPDKAVDDMLRDFFGGRLPPYGKGVKKGDFITYVCYILKVMP